jgi:hypothetical protein
LSTPDLENRKVKSPPDFYHASKDAFNLSLYRNRETTEKDNFSFGVDTTPEVKNK